MRVVYLAPMKAPILALLFFFGVVAYGQTDSTASPYGRTEVVEVDSTVPADFLMMKSKKWFVDHFKDANQVIEVDDPSTHTLIGKAWIAIGTYDAIHYTVEVQSKEGGSRIRIYDVEHQGRGSINLGNGPVPMPSFGRLYDSETCYSIEKGGQKRMLKKCAEWKPEINSHLDGIINSLRSELIDNSANDW